MLANIRKPYLNVDVRNQPLARQASARTIDFAGPGSDQSWSGIRHFTNEERDQIDLQARVILSRCAERVKEMEKLEKRANLLIGLCSCRIYFLSINTGRAELVANRTTPLARLLPSRLLPSSSSTASSDVIAAHHSSITWYLSRRLAEASQTQKEMQEERVKRQLERTKTLGSGVAREAAILDRGESFVEVERPGGGSGAGWLASSVAATIGAPLPGVSSRSPSQDILQPPLDDLDVDSDEEEIELSQSQILQFETENAHILRTVQDTLESVQLAESRLMDISALQMELVTHLTKQTELTDQLYEDAMTTTATVEKGNVQLREAKRRAKDSRLFILMFLIGASLSLLFLHYY